MKYYYKALGAYGLFLAIKAKIMQSPIVIKATRSEIKFPFYIRIPSSDGSTYRQIFINQEYNFKVSHNPKVIVDAGANIGLASIYFANRFPNSLVFSIEPEERNFELLRKNTKPYTNITPIQGAVWNKNMKLDLVDSGRDEWGYTTQLNNMRDKPINKIDIVNGMTVDHIMKEYNISYIDILKVDIEGAEREVFSDPSSWIMNVGSIIIELHEHKKLGCNRSFYNSTNSFDTEWKEGENIYLSRYDGCLVKPTI